MKMLSGRPQFKVKEPARPYQLDFPQGFWNQNAETQGTAWELGDDYRQCRVILSQYSSPHPGLLPRARVIKEQTHSLQPHGDRLSEHRPCNKPSKPQEG